MNENIEILDHLALKRPLIAELIGDLTPVVLDAGEPQLYSNPIP